MRVVGDVQWDQKTPVSQEETGSSMLCGVYASLHRGRLTDGGIKWCSVVLGVPSIETPKVEWPEGKQ